MSSDPGHRPPSIARARERMLRDLHRELGDGPALDAFAKVPREDFVLPEDLDDAYEDRPLPIGFGQTISQPLIVAMTIRALDPGRDHRVLDVGSGSGYQAAVLALLVREVIAVELVPQLVERSRNTLRRLGLDNVEVLPAGETLGWPPLAPYEGIAVAAAAPEIPESLVAQLAEGGCLVVPVGPRDLQELVVVTREGPGHRVRSLGACRFVPLLGEDAWPRDEA